MKKAVNPELQKLLDRSRELRIEAARLIEQADAVDAEAAKLAPVKVGDVIPTHGHSYKGKNMRVIRVSISRAGFAGFGEKLRFRAFGNVLKKDGTEGTTCASVYWDMVGVEVEGAYL